MASGLLIDERLATLIVARAATSARPLGPAELAKHLQRFAPATIAEPVWHEHIAAALGAGLALDHRELVRRIGKHGAKTWQQLAERVLPALALGVAANDAKSHAKLAGRDAWAAAIVARALGLWTDGTPPSLGATCDAYAWRQLGLAGKPKRCPPEIRALFFERELAIAGPPERLLRLFAAKQVGAPRAELRALLDALVRGWLEGKQLGTIPPHDFVDEVRGVARATSRGVFGDRKVFIASVWDELRRQPTWASLTLDDFKARLVRAHRAGDLVLARADLVAAMNHELVAASETTTEGASFHFIVREDVT